MKTKDKFFTLLKEGFTLKTLRKMNESQLNVLYKKVVKEQDTTSKTEKIKNDLMLAKQTAQELSAELGEEELNEWGSSDQNIMNASIHRDLGEPEEMPNPFDSRLESAAESAVDFYWDDWEEYQTDREGLIDDAKRRYLRSYFPEKFDMLVRMFEPAPYDVKIDGELDEGQATNDLDKMAGVDPNEDPNPEGNEDGPSNYGVNPKKDKSMNDGMGIDEGKKKPSKMKTPITTLGMFEDEIKEKSVSKQQQKIMGLALSVKRGETPKSEVSKEVLDIVDNMTEKELEDFASTEHKGLPKKVETNEGTRCWKGYEKKGMKTMFGKRVPNCVKKESKEDKVRQIEESIVSLLKNYKKPTMTKKDLLEQGTKEAPVKTPTKTPSKPDRKTPYKPKHRPAPKAGDTKTAPTRTKPGTKEKPGKSTPYQPKHRPAPKAGETQEIPSFLKFDNLNITFRDE